MNNSGKTSIKAFTTAGQQRMSNDKKMSAAKAFIILMIGVLALAYSAILVKDANFEPATSAFLRCSIAFFVLLPFAFLEIKKKVFLINVVFLSP
jgi:hypothetical protein